MPRTRSRADVVTHLEVQNAFLIHGVDRVADLFAKGAASRGTIRRAVNELMEQDKELAAPFETWFVENVGPIGRGRTRPEDGDLRSYKVQQLNNGDDPYIRLPLPQYVKGEVVMARFDGREVHCRPRDPAPPEVADEAA